MHVYTCQLTKSQLGVSWMSFRIYVRAEAENVAERAGMLCLQSAAAGAMQATFPSKGQNQEPHGKTRLHELHDRHS